MIEVPVYRWAPPHGPGPAAPHGRPGHRPAGRRGHVHLRAGGDRAAARGRARRATPCSTRCAPTCSPPVWARSRRRRCAGTACPWSRPGGPGWARWSARSSRSCRRGRSRSGWPGTTLTLRGHAAVVDGELKPLAPAPMAVLRALAATPGPGALPGGPAAHAAARRRRARRGDGRGPAARRLGVPRAWSRRWSSAATGSRSTDVARRTPVLTLQFGQQVSLPAVVRQPRACPVRYACRSCATCDW